MIWYKQQWFWAILAALPYTAWEFGHWWLELGVYTPWAFGQGFAVGSLIFGFWSIGVRLFSRAPILSEERASRAGPSMDIEQSESPLGEIEEADAITVDLDRARVRRQGF